MYTLDPCGGEPASGGVATMNANAVYTGSMVSSTRFTDYPEIVSEWLR